MRVSVSPGFRPILRRPNEFPLEDLLAQTKKRWEEWTSKHPVGGVSRRYEDAVTRSLVTLKALTYAPTGALVAAPTTSLPECIGGSRNWDYRFCWLRDASFILKAFAEAGYTEELIRWHRWLLRAVAGHPSQMNVMYGIMGDRLLTEFSLDWFDGYEGSAPVRVGNAASSQFQLDVFGEVLESFQIAADAGIDSDESSWQIVITLLDFLEDHWRDPDSGIWEVRGGTRQFTHSRVMAWVAADRAARIAAHHGDTDRQTRWSQLAETIHANVCEHGFDPGKNAFVQTYGSLELDAALLLIPAVGFLPAKDSRVIGTIEAVERELVSDGLVRRYDTASKVDGVDESEGLFLPCSFWLADCYVMTGQQDRATQLFEKLLGLRNDVGLLSEEYDPAASRLLGNFPQALSHVALINTARRVSQANKS